MAEENLCVCLHFQLSLVVSPFFFSQAFSLYFVKWCGTLTSPCQVLPYQLSHSPQFPHVLEICSLQVIQNRQQALLWLCPCSKNSYQYHGQNDLNILYLFFFVLFCFWEKIFNISMSVSGKSMWTPRISCVQSGIELTLCFVWRTGTYQSLIVRTRYYVL